MEAWHVNVDLLTAWWPKFVSQPSRWLSRVTFMTTFYFLLLQNLWLLQGNPASYSGRDTKEGSQGETEKKCAYALLEEEIFDDVIQQSGSGFFVNCYAARWKHSDRTRSNMAHTCWLNTPSDVSASPAAPVCSVSLPNIDLQAFTASHLLSAIFW